MPQPVAFFPLNGKYGAKEYKNRLPEGYKGIVNPAPGPNGEPDGSLQFMGDRNSFVRLIGFKDVWNPREFSFTVTCWFYLDYLHGPIFASSGGTGVELFLMHRHLFGSFVRKTTRYPEIKSHKLDLGKWYYVALTYDHNTGIENLWLNGELHATLNMGVITQEDLAPEVASGSAPTYNLFFTGRIVQLKVYNVALSAAQVEATNNVRTGKYIFVVILVSKK